MFDLNWLRNWLLPVLWTLQIFYFSLLPRGSYPNIDDQHLGTSYLQYAYHFGQFFCLALLLYRSVLRSAVSKTPRPRSYALKHAFLAIAIIAFLDELIQIPVPARKFAVPDVLADMAGGCFGLLLMQMVKRSNDLDRHELDSRITR